MLKKPSLHIPLVLILLLSGCGWSADTELAELSVIEFHGLYNAGDFDTIYSNASPEFKEFVTAQNFTRLLQKLHKNLGQHESSTLVKWSAKSMLREGTTITLIYKAEYENNVMAQEQFTYKVDKSRAQLYNFNVSSENIPQNNGKNETDA